MVAFGQFLEVLHRRPAGRHALFAGGAGLRADLQGLRRVQLRAGRDGAVRRRWRWCARSTGWSPRASRSGRRSSLGLLFAGVIMAITAWLVERSCSGRWSTRTASPVHGDPRRHLLPRGRRRRCCSAPTSIRCGCSERCLVPVREHFPGRHPGQQDRRLGRGDRGRAGRGAGAVLPEDQDRPRAARRRRRSRGRAVGRHSARLDLVRRLAGRRPRRAGRRRPSGAPSSACSSRSRSWR